MIINGGAAGNVGYWGAHLQRTDTNDRADVMEISGLLSTNMPSALREMEAIAAQSRSSGNFMYQANINPRDNERLTEAQWREAIDTLENHLGFAGHQRVVIEHEKEGRVHRHVIWNRVDVETLRVADIGGDYYTHERVGRTLELKFDLRRTASLHGERHPEGRPERAEELWEKRAADRSGIDPKVIRAELTELWGKTDSGRAFAAAIEEQGYILAQGDRRNFCIVDQAGDVHSLARRIDGVKTKDVRERLADIDATQLPTVEEARTVQREKYPTKEAAGAAWESRNSADAHTPRQAQNAPQESVEAAKEYSATAAQERAQRQQDYADRVAARETISKAKATQQGRAQAANDINVGARETVRNVKDVGLKVVDAAGALSSLSSFAEFLLGFGGGGQAANDGGDRNADRRRAAAALERISDSIERGDNLRASDLAHLMPSHLENIKRHGDDFIREMIADLERGRQRDDEYGRSRER